MAKFFENNLRPEESFAGYNVGEPDDDIFQIKDNVYPDNIEEFIFKEPVLSMDEPDNAPILEEIEPFIEENIQPDIINADITENSSDNIWDSFQDDSETSSSDNYLSDEEDLLSSKPITPNEIIQEFENTNIQEIEREPDILETKQEIKLELDDDFKRQLAEQLASSKARKNKDSKENDLNENTVIEKADFVPVEEVDNAQFFDLTEFGNERPSEKEEEKDQKPKLDDKSDTGVKDKKGSRLPLIIGLTAASIVVLAGLAYLIMYYLVPNFYKEDKIVLKDSTKKEQSIAKTDSLKKVEKPEVEKEVEKEIHKDAEKVSEKDTEEDVIAKINQQYAKAAEKKEKAEEKVERNVADKKITVAKDELKQKVQVKKEEIQVIKEKIAIKEKPKVIKETKKETKKEERKVDIVKEVKPKEEVKREDKITDAVYTIQVYSSPSKEDALDWVNKLKSKNIQAEVSEQMIRDVKWYRVRFGNYSTREEAKAVALRNGFSQTWIDRIK